MGRADQPADAIEYGRLLFNERRFFEAHEAWERAWHLESGDRRILLQGLIQIAAALHKIQRADLPGGCARLLDAGLAKLSEAPVLDQIDLRAFRAGVIAFRHSAERWLAGVPEVAPPAGFPILDRAT